MAGVEKKINGFYAFLLFLFSPILSLFVGLRNCRSSWAKNVIWLFVIFYAISFNIPSQSSDAFRYKERLERMHRIQPDFSDFLGNFYTPEENSNYFLAPFDDVIHPVLTYIVSSFTDNFRVLYFFVGIIFGFFYSRNIWMLVDAVKTRLKPIHVLLILSFALIIPFWNLNSIRMWTAAHIFFYGAMIFLKNDKKKSGGAIIFLSILMHFSFLLPVLVFVIYKILGNRTKIFFIFFMISFFINEIDLAFVQKSLTSFLPEFLHENVQAYTPDEEFVKGTKATSWHAIYYALALKWSIFLTVVLLYFSGYSKIKDSKYLLSLFSFTLLLLSVSQLGSTIPSLGRFLKVADLFVIVTFIYFLVLVNTTSEVKRFFYFFSPGLLFFCVVSLRIGFDSINVGIFGNIFTLLLMGPIEVPLIELIK